MRAEDAVGRYGERVAVRHLRDQGMHVLARNWRSPDRDVPGELDVVALDGSTAVVVEVKTRRTSRAGTALEAVTPAKLARLRRLAGVLLATGLGPGGTLRVRAVRIDVVAVEVARSGPATVHHVRAVG